MKKYPKIDANSVISLTRKYGSNAIEILNNIAKYSDQKHGLLLAEIDYSIENEMCLSLGDFIVRRTGRLYFERPSLEEIYPIIHQHINSKLAISESNASQDLEVFEKEYHAVMNFIK